MKISIIEDFNKVKEIKEISFNDIEKIIKIKKSNKELKKLKDTNNKDQKQTFFDLKKIPSICFTTFKNSKRNIANAKEIHGIYIDIDNKSDKPIDILDLIDFLKNKNLTFCFLESITSSETNQKGHLIIPFENGIEIDEDTRNKAHYFYNALKDKIFEDWTDKDQINDKENVDIAVKDLFSRIMFCSGNESYFEINIGEYINAFEILENITVSEFKKEDKQIKTDNIINIHNKFWNCNTEQRHPHLTSSIGYELQKGTSYNSIISIACNWNKNLKKPLPQEEIKRTINTVIKTNKNNNVDKFVTLTSVAQEHCKSIYKIFFDIIEKNYKVVLKNKKRTIKEFKKDQLTQFLISEFKRFDSTLDPKKIKKLIANNCESKECVYLPTKPYGDIERDLSSFNICKMPVLKETENKNFDFIKKILKNLFNDELDFFYNWLAYFYQKKEKSRISFLIRGEKGVGKGLLCEIIIPRLFGKSNCSQASDSQLETDFNGWLVNKMFINLNEIARDYIARTKVKNKIKNLITANEVIINKKNIEQYETKIYCNFIITSNENIPIDLEQNDRRFVVVESYGILNKFDWFKEVEDVEAKIKEEIPAFANFLKKYKTNKRYYHLAYETEAKQKITENSISPADLFIYKLFKKDLEYFYDELDLVVDKEQNIAELKNIVQVAFETSFIISRDIIELSNALKIFKNKNFIINKINESEHSSKKTRKRIGETQYRGYVLE